MGHARALPEALAEAAADSLDPEMTRLVIIIASGILVAGALLLGAIDRGR